MGYRAAHVAHVRASDLPCQRKPVREAILHPIGAELGRQIEIERARLLAVRARLDRLDPLAVHLLAEVLAQPLADVGPIGRQVQSFGILFHFHPHQFCLLARRLRCRSRCNPCHPIASMI